MLKVIARAMALMYNGGDWDKDYTPEQKEVHYIRARELLKLMESPSGSMEVAGDQAIREHYCPADVWRFMVLAALED